MQLQTTLNGGLMIQAPQNYAPVQQAPVQQTPYSQPQVNAVNIQIFDPKSFAQPDPVYNYPEAPIYQYPEAQKSN